MEFIRQTSPDVGLGLNVELIPQKSATECHGAAPYENHASSGVDPKARGIKPLLAKRRTPSREYQIRQLSDKLTSLIKIQQTA